MTAPRLQIDLNKIRHNARVLVERLGRRGISVTGVTKATLGSPDIAGALLAAGVQTLGDSRIENIEAMRHASVPAQMTLIRSPMLSQVERVVKSADVSFNTELDVIRALSTAACGTNRKHGIVLMVELGDLREGILPDDVESTVREMLRLPNVVFKGLGTNLACRCGVSPGTKNMAELSAIADSIEAKFGLNLDIISGGNSANLNWVFNSSDTGRINDLRLGEAILLGCEPLHRQPIDGLFTDAITLVAEVIESKFKPSLPWGETAQNAFGDNSSITDRGQVAQTILAIGRQDVDPSGLHPELNVQILGASSDHLVVDSGNKLLPAGTELTFHLNYSSLLSTMTSPFVTKVIKVPTDAPVRSTANNFD